MPDPTLLTAAEAAARLRLDAATRTIRRRLAALCVQAGVAPVRIGRTALYTADDVARMIEAARCPYTYAAAAPSGTRAGRSASAVKASRSPSSARDAALALMQRPSRKPKPPASGKSALRVLPGGRAV